MAEFMLPPKRAGFSGSSAPCSAQGAGRGAVVAAELGGRAALRAGDLRGMGPGGPEAGDGRGWREGAWLWSVALEGKGARGDRGPRRGEGEGGKG